MVLFDTSVRFLTVALGPLPRLEGGIYPPEEDDNDGILASMIWCLFTYLPFVCLCSDPLTDLFSENKS